MLVNWIQSIRSALRVLYATTVAYREDFRHNIPHDYAKVARAWAKSLADACRQALSDGCSLGDTIEFSHGSSDEIDFKRLYCFQDNTHSYLAIKSSEEEADLYSVAVHPFQLACILHDMKEDGCSQSEINETVSDELNALENIQAKLRAKGLDDNSTLGLLEGNTPSQIIEESLTVWDSYPVTGDYGETPDEDPLAGLMDLLQMFGEDAFEAEDL